MGEKGSVRLPGVLLGTAWDAGFLVVGAAALVGGRLLRRGAATCPERSVPDGGGRP